MVVRVTERERATILAALRRWLSYPAAREAYPTATSRGKYKPLYDGEIQRLCQRLSKTAGRGNAALLRRHSNNGAGMQKQLDGSCSQPRLTTSGTTPLFVHLDDSAGMVQHADNRPLRPEMRAILCVGDRVTNRVGPCIPDRSVSK